MSGFNVSRPMPDGSPGSPGSPVRPVLLPGRSASDYFQPVAASSRRSNMGIMVWTYVLVRWLSSL